MKETSIYLQNQLIILGICMTIKRKPQNRTYLFSLHKYNYKLYNLLCIFLQFRTIFLTLYFILCSGKVSFFISRETFFYLGVPGDVDCLRTLPHHNFCSTGKKQAWNPGKSFEWGIWIYWFIKKDKFVLHFRMQIKP